MVYILIRIIFYSLIETKISALEQDDLELRANVDDVPYRLEPANLRFADIPRHVFCLFSIFQILINMCADFYISACHSQRTTPRAPARPKKRAVA